VILACVSALFAKCTADAQKDLEELHRKQTFIETFTNLALTLEFRERDILLNAAPPAQRTGPAYEESAKKGEEEHRYWLEKSSGTTPEAAIYIAKALFPKKEIVTELDMLLNNLYRYSTTMNLQELHNAYASIQSGFDKIIGLMVADLR
jgi:hypothetical protein